MSNQKVWFITGASKGLGLALVKRLLAEGFKVAATSRKMSELTEAVGTHDSFLPLEVDVTGEASVKEAINKTISKFGSLDAIVNNAGYGLPGALEELPLEDIKKEFEVNVFAMINVIRQALPQMRKQRSGHIFNIGDSLRQRPPVISRGMVIDWIRISLECALRNGFEPDSGLLSIILIHI